MKLFPETNIEPLLIEWYVIETQQFGDHHKVSDRFIEGWLGSGIVTPGTFGHYRVNFRGSLTLKDFKTIHTILVRKYNRDLKNLEL